MKNSLRLSMLAMLSFVTPSVVSLFNQNIADLTQSNHQEQATEFYWNENHDELEIDYTWDEINGTYFFIRKINIGETEISNYKTFSVIDSNSTSYTKTSWGNTEYFGMSFKEYQNKEIEEFFYQGRIWSPQLVYLKSKMVLLKTEDWQGLAKMATLQKVGLSYYTEYDGKNYIQIFGVMYAESWWSFSGGGMWLNLGQGIRFES